MHSHSSFTYPLRHFWLLLLYYKLLGSTNCDPGLVLEPLWVVVGTTVLLWDDITFYCISMPCWITIWGQISVNAHRKTHKYKDLYNAHRTIQINLRVHTEGFKQTFLSTWINLDSCSFVDRFTFVSGRRGTSRKSIFFNMGLSVAN